MTRKKPWPDGQERVCDGCIVIFGRFEDRRYRNTLPVALLPREVRDIMNESEPDDMLELPHNADPEVLVYVRNKEILALDVIWSKIEEG